jgi:alkylation response protein AidB-like acyl-CoA dehydrogenase
MLLATLASYDISVALFLMLQAPLCGKTLEKLGSQEQQDKYLPSLAKIEKVWGWALTEERIGSHASQI